MLSFGLALIFALTPKIDHANDSKPHATLHSEAKVGMSAETLSRQLSNPVSSVGSMMFQNNYTQLKNNTGDVPG